MKRYENKGICEKCKLNLYWDHVENRFICNCYKLENETEAV